MGYNDNDVIRPLCVRLPKMAGYAKKFDANATMSFRANNKYGKKLKIDFESKPVYGDDDKYIKTKTKIYPDSMITKKCLKKQHYASVYQ